MITIRRHTDGRAIWVGDLRGTPRRWTSRTPAHLDLRDADLRDVNLQHVDLRDVDLRGADLRGANLRGARLRCTDLRGAKLCPSSLLLAWWGYVSDDLCRDLMRLDASAHPNPTAFTRWAKGDRCPYDGLLLERAVHFHERRECWRAGKPPSIFSLVCRLLAEADCKWDWDKNGKPVTDKKRVAKKGR